ncbi:YqhR family membrane protein [Cytobacillus sp. FSL R7-0696]|uniref:YqhR family membrane protein n=1 Tax=Cytobacillus sp. FSL R7-0696 TaxID=2921691 RepID=UPI0030F7B15A
MSDKHELEQNEREQPLSMTSLTFISGFVGGVFWSTIGYIAYVLNLTEVGPRVILEPWTIGDWKDGWLGTVISIILIGAVSVVAAYIYYWTMRRFKKMWFGALYGLVLFALVFFVLNPMFPNIAPVGDLKINTIITSVCLYLLYGVFVGYSISYENEEQQKMKEAQETEEA